MRNRMKIVTLMTAIALFSIMVLISCEKDKTYPVSNFPAITENPAYAIAGAYDVRDASDLAMPNYIMIIEPGQDYEEGIWLTNFMGRDIRLSAIYENGQFKIPKQTFTNSTQTEPLIISGELITTTNGKATMVIYELQSGNVTSNSYARCDFRPNN